MVSLKIFRQSVSKYEFTAGSNTDLAQDHVIHNEVRSYTRYNSRDERRGASGGSTCFRVDVCNAALKRVPTFPDSTAARCGEIEMDRDHNMGWMDHLWRQRPA
jgi:hypothetical protein